MKKNTVHLSVCIFFAVLICFSSCSTLNSKSVQSSSHETYRNVKSGESDDRFVLPPEGKDSSLRISSDADLSVDGINIADVRLDGFFDGGNQYGTSFYYLSVSNKTDSPLKIVWDNCAVYYPGHSSHVFIPGQKYSELNSTVLSTVVPENGFHSTRIYSSDQIVYDGVWSVYNISHYDTRVVICLESAAGRQTYYVFTFSSDIHTDDVIIENTEDVTKIETVKETETELSPDYINENKSDSENL